MLFKKIRTWLHWKKRLNHAQNLYDIELKHYITIKQRIMYYRKQDVIDMIRTLNRKERLYRYLHGRNPWRKHAKDPRRF